jgi:hypothetical protein
VLALTSILVGQNAKREDAKAHYLVACLVEAQPRESIVNKVRKGKYRSKEDVLRQCAYRQMTY